ncbi:MAG: 23S rRNA (uracil(1939)-C(5))-methyltransferase RlmD [Candidatus Margulisbacteria bacterium]|nr:23S rRNA (uracil(1939)-C(5))-methyltransferase RlmD [Candidatus Margulisiibacteriota bacterium]
MYYKIMQLTIEKLANTGEGIGYYNERTVFVPYSFPGEIVDISITKQPKKGVIWGKIEKIITPHPKRLSNNPPFPGCDWQNLDYSAQIQFKENILKDTLQYFGKFNINQFPLKPTVKSPKIWQYRNKITLTFSKDSLGFYAPKTHQITPILDIPLIPNHIQEYLINLDIYFKKKKIPFYQPEEDKGELRQLVLKWNSSQEILLGLITRDNKLSKKEDLVNELPQINIAGSKLTGLIQSINKLPQENKLSLKNKLLWGNPYIIETINNIAYAHSLSSFFQTNLDVAKLLLDQIDQWIKQDASSVLFDLYGGIGFLSIALAKKLGQINIIENNAEAIEMALMNNNINSLNNVKLQQETVENFFMINKLIPQVIFIDPPRKGCAPQVIEGLLKLTPKQIVYTSCFPVTLARDLQHLTMNNGYSIKEIVPFDMFPQTPHLETMALLERIS